MYLSLNWNIKNLNPQADCLHASSQQKWDSICANYLDSTPPCSLPFHNNVYRVTVKVLLNFINQLATWFGSCGSERIEWLTSTNISWKIAKSFFRMEVESIGTCLEKGASVFACCKNFAIVSERNVYFPLMWTWFVRSGLRNVLKYFDNFL